MCAGYIRSESSQDPPASFRRWDHGTYQKIYNLVGGKQRSSSTREPKTELSLSWITRIKWNATESYIASLSGSKIEQRIIHIPEERFQDTSSSQSCSSPKMTPNTGLLGRADIVPVPWEGPSREGPFHIRTCGSSQRRGRGAGSGARPH